MSEKKYKFTKFTPGTLGTEPRHQEYEKTESEFTQAEREHHLGNLINTWENTCGWAQMEFLKKLTPHFEYREMTNSEVLEELNKLNFK